MLRHKPVLPPEDIFPVDEWKIEQRRFDYRFLAQEETIFSVANGYLGLRGSYEEGRPNVHDETFINGFYETWPIIYGETAYGFAKTGQTIVNVSNAKIIRLYVDDEPFDLSTARIVTFRRALNMQTGTLDREVVWETGSGKRVKVTSSRLVSFRHRHLAAIDYRVDLLDGEAPVILASEIFTELGGVAGVSEFDEELDPRKARKFKGQVLMPQHHTIDEARILLSFSTHRSGLLMACGIDHMLTTDCDYRVDTSGSELGGRILYRIEAKAGQSIHLSKFLTYHTDPRTNPKELCDRVGWSLDHALGQGVETIFRDQRAVLDDFWHRSDILIQGNSPRAQQCLRFNLFHLLQASGRADNTGIAAKGLTGQAYDGHYFWDTEIYVLPFLTYTSPNLARNQLRFRSQILDKARQRAREVNQNGALYPWRTINGEEASAYYAAGTAQYHINADIVYALRRYVQATGDIEFLHQWGVEILVETARLWVDLGFFQSNGDRKFHIFGVTGPDEYTAIVNDNLYTNLMARDNLRYAVEIIESLRTDHPRIYTRLVRETKLEVSEIENWKQAAEVMCIPFDKALGIHPQDDDFLYKKPWDLASTPRDKFPLLLNYHPLVLYRSQVIKQADVVLAMLLLSSQFTHEQKERNFHYYEHLTTGDSSLSACIQSILAWEVGDEERAQQYLEYAVLMDLADVGGNVRDGIHIASAGGAWMIFVYGIAGMRDDNGGIRFAPRLPEGVDCIRFPLTLRNHRLEVDLRPDAATYTLRDGPGLTIYHEDEPLHLEPERPVSRPLCV